MGSHLCTGYTYRLIFHAGSLLNPEPHRPTCLITKTSMGRIANTSKGMNMEKKNAFIVLQMQIRYNNRTGKIILILKRYEKPKTQQSAVTAPGWSWPSSRVPTRSVRSTGEDKKEQRRQQLYGSNLGCVGAADLRSTRTGSMPGTGFITAAALQVLDSTRDQRPFINFLLITPKSFIFLA